MATNPLVTVKWRSLNVSDLNRQAQDALLAQRNRMRAQVELAREAVTAISHTFVYSEYQVSLALIATKAIEDSLAEAGIPQEEYQAYSRLLWHEYLEKMATVTHTTADAISRQVEERP